MNSWVLLRANFLISSVYCLLCSSVCLCPFQLLSPRPGPQEPSPDLPFFSILSLPKGTGALGWTSWIYRAASGPHCVFKCHQELPSPSIPPFSSWKATGLSGPSPGKTSNQVCESIPGLKDSCGTISISINKLAWTTHYLSSQVHLQFRFGRQESHCHLKSCMWQLYLPWLTQARCDKCKTNPKSSTLSSIPWWPCATCSFTALLKWFLEVLKCGGLVPSENWICYKSTGKVGSHFWPVFCTLQSVRERWCLYH